MIPTLKINHGQLVATIELLKSKVALREKYLATLKAKGQEERELIKQAGPALGFGGSREMQLYRYINAHQEFERSQSEIEQVVIHELKSQLAIHEAMLQEGERGSNLVVPAPRM